MSRFLMSMALVFLCGILCASTTVKVESLKKVKVCTAGDQLELSITLDEEEDEICELTVFIESGKSVEKLGTILCRKGKNLGKWLISEKYAGKTVSLKFVDSNDKTKAYSEEIKVIENKPK